MVSFRMFRKSIILLLLISFISSTLTRPAHAQGVQELPVPGTMVALSPAFEPVLLKGIKVDPQNPFAFDFIVDTGSDPAMAGEAKQSQLKSQADTLIKYFLAAMTVPEKDLWVNLSPYEKDRMIAPDLGQTEMGRDMLAQDYVLKQLTASLIYPEKELGKTFWDKVYAKTRELYGSTEVPVNTFNKVWIVADRADIFERGNTAYVTGAHLKVMLAEDYTAMEKHTAAGAGPASLASQIVREVILPELEKEVNTGQNFAPLRQMFYAMILASWYKTALKDAVLTQVYGNQGKVSFGINAADEGEKDKIFERYLQAYKKGVFNYIKDTVAADGAQTPRKYFSGGADFAMLGTPGFLHRSQNLPKSGPITGKVFKVSGDAAMNSGPSSLPGQMESPDFGRIFDGETILSIVRQDSYIDLRNLAASIWEALHKPDKGLQKIEIIEKGTGLLRGYFYKLHPDGVAILLSANDRARLPLGAGYVHVQLDASKEAYAFLSGKDIILVTSGFTITPDQEPAGEQAVIDVKHPLYGKMVLVTDPREPIRRTLREAFEGKGASVMEFIGKPEDIHRHVRGVDLIVMPASNGGKHGTRDGALDTAKFLSDQGKTVIIFTQQEPKEITDELWNLGIRSGSNVVVVPKRSGASNVVLHARWLFEKEKDRAMLSLVPRPQLDFFTDVQPRFDAFETAIHEAEQIYGKPYADKEALALLYQEAWKKSGDQEFLWEVLVKIEDLQESFDQYELALIEPVWGNVIDTEDTPGIFEGKMKLSVEEAYARMEVIFNEKIEDARDEERDGFVDLFKWAQAEYRRAQARPENAQARVFAMAALNAAHDYFTWRGTDQAMSTEPLSLKGSIYERLAWFRSVGNNAMADNMIVLMAVLVQDNKGPIEIQQYAAQDRLQQLIEDFAAAVRKMGKGRSALRGFLARGYPLVQDATTLGPAFNLEALIVFSGTMRRKEDLVMTPDELTAVGSLPTGTLKGREIFSGIKKGDSVIPYCLREEEIHPHADLPGIVDSIDAEAGTVTIRVFALGRELGTEIYYANAYDMQRHLRLLGVKVVGPDQAMNSPQVSRKLTPALKAIWDDGEQLILEFEEKYEQFKQKVEGKKAEGKENEGNGTEGDEAEGKKAFEGLNHRFANAISQFKGLFHLARLDGRMSAADYEHVATSIGTLAQFMHKYKDYGNAGILRAWADEIFEKHGTLANAKARGHEYTYLTAMFINEGRFTPEFTLKVGELEAEFEKTSPSGSIEEIVDHLRSYDDFMNAMERYEKGGDEAMVAVQKMRSLLKDHRIRGLAAGIILASLPLVVGSYKAKADGERLRKIDAFVHIALVDPDEKIKELARREAVRSINAGFDGSWSWLPTHEKYINGLMLREKLLKDMGRLNTSMKELKALASDNTQSLAELEGLVGGFLKIADAVSGEKWEEAVTLAANFVDKADQALDGNGSTGMMNTLMSKGGTLRPLLLRMREEANKIWGDALFATGRTGKGGPYKLPRPPDQAMLGEWQDSRTNGFIYRFGWMGPDGQRITLRTRPVDQEGAREGYIIYDIYLTPAGGPQILSDNQHFYKGSVRLYVEEGRILAWVEPDISPSHRKDFPWLAELIKEKLAALYVQGASLFEPVSNAEGSREARLNTLVSRSTAKHQELLLRLMQMFVAYQRGGLLAFKNTIMPKDRGRLIKRFIAEYEADTEALQEFGPIAVLMSPSVSVAVIENMIKGLGLFMRHEIDPAMTGPGGIDLDRNKMQMNIRKEGRGVDMQFNQDLVERIRRQGFDGLEFNIRSIVPIIDLRQFLFA